MSSGSEVQPGNRVGASPEQIVLETRALSKSFGSVRAIIEVSMTLRRGEILGLVGDNGAGKSTFVKCLSGIVRPDSGSILVDGVEVRLANPEAARSLGIETVYQDLALVGNLDVAANIFLKRELVKGRGVVRALSWLNKKEMHIESDRIIGRLGISIPSVREPVESLSGGQRQAVAIGRAVAWGRHIVLMDEPAAALGVEQSRIIFELIRNLSEAGVSVLFIGHNMQHILEACHRVIVFRHGRTVADVATGDVTGRDLVAFITGVAG